MSARRHTIPVLSLWLTLPLAAGCTQGERLPTALSRSSQTPTAAAPISGPDDRHESRRGIVSEARETLGAVLTSEQTHYQVFLTYTEAADTADIRVKLGVDLREPSARWTFSVTGVSSAGFTAVARGRPGTSAEGFVATLRYQRERGWKWNIRRERS